MAARTKKAHRVVVLDLSGLSAFTDYFVIASADNRVQLRAMADVTLERLGEVGVQPHHTEGYDETGWILLDCGGVVVHYFLDDRREYFGLERLWGDALRVEIPSDASDQGGSEKGEYHEG